MPHKPPTIDIVSETIGNILKGAQRPLQVPINQRSYSWKPEHVKELYADLAAAIADGRVEYFLGAIVVVRAEDATLVFDGQQRLATSLILIAAIRDYFHRTSDKETAQLIQAASLLSKDRKTHAETPHFRLNAEDNDFFLKRILRNPDDDERKGAKANSQKESHKRIDSAAAEAASFVNGIIVNLPNVEKGKQLHRWLDFLEDGARVIWVEVADEPTAFTIFETMNDRGLRLSAADLLKNYMYGMSDDRQHEVVQKWQAMSGVLESLQDDDAHVVDFIRYFWIATHGPTRTRDLYDQIKAEVNNKTKIVTFASKLEKASHDYAALLNASHETWAEYGADVRQAIATLSVLGVTQLRPLLLAAFPHFKPKEFKRLLHACTSWSVRAFIAGVPSGTLEGYYGRNAFKVGQKQITTVDELIKDMMQVMPDDERFAAAVATANVANAQLARYYLRSLQLAKDNEKEPQYVPNESIAVTLEHILPNKPGKNWAHINPDDAKALCNRLGNQVLLAGSVNSKLGNASYADKQAALKNSPFSLTKLASDKKGWALEQINERQTQLAKLALKAWPLKV